MAKNVFTNGELPIFNFRNVMLEMLGLHFLENIWIFVNDISNLFVLIWNSAKVFIICWIFKAVYNVLFECVGYQEKNKC